MFELKELQNNILNKINCEKELSEYLISEEDFFRSYYDVFKNRKFISKNYLSRSYDASQFKNTLNLKKNLLKMNNSLLMNESVDLQWFPEPDYQNALKNIFEHELNQTFFSNSYSNENSNQDLCTEESKESKNFSKQSFLQNSNYESLSRDLDANLAHVDMENFNRKDINYLLNGINCKFSNSDELQSLNEQFINNIYLSDFLENGLYENSQSNKNNIIDSNYVFDKQALNSSFTIDSDRKDKSSSISCDENILTNRTLTNFGSLGISVDSLDMSCFEQECADVVNKCKKQDKSKYTIAFEELYESFMSLNNSISNNKQNNNENLDKNSKINELMAKSQIKTKDDDNEKYFLFRQHLRQKLKERNNERFTKSEHSVSKLLNEKNKEKFNLNLSTNITNRNLNNLITKSLNNDSQFYSKYFTKSDLEESNQYVPLFNLNSSYTCCNLTPKNLIQHFIKNKILLSSSSEQLNVTYDEFKNSILSTSKQYSTSNNQINNESEVMNKVNSKEDSNSKYKNQNSIFNDYTNHNNNYSQSSASFNNEKNFKLPFNRQAQASPIHEEDENVSNSVSLGKENKKYTNFQKINKNLKLDSSLQVNENEIERNQTCPHSLSMNNFKNNSNEYIKKRNLILDRKFYIPVDMNSNKRNNSKLNKISNLRDCSVSSGYFSGGSYNLIDLNRKKNSANINLISLNNNNTLPVKNSQISVQDKQIQTSILENNEDFKIYQNQQPTPIILNDLNKCCSNNCSNGPIYVYYPNYSLPDLNFVNNSFYNLVHLSPTKYQLPNFEVPNHMNKTGCLHSKRNKFKVRPKSCGDFENLTKDSFKHIKDWDSLNTLLPVEIRNLIENIKAETNKEQGESISKCKTTSNTPTSFKTFAPKQKTNLENGVKLRSKLRNGNSLDLQENLNLKTNEECCFDHCIHRNQKVNSKRFSLPLQEPTLYLENNVNCCNSQNTYAASNLSHNSLNNTKRGMIKSATMNMPIICQQHCSQIHSKRFYRTPCHSCFNFNSNQQYLCNSSDYCCQSNLSTYNQNFSHCLKTNQLTKTFNPITELCEENEFESLNYLINNIPKGDIDFDQLINPEKTNCKNLVEKNKNNIVSDSSKEVKKKENFKDLKTHWEKIAKISTNSLNSTKTLVNAKKINSNLKKTSKPSSLIKSKVNSKRSRSKSPEKSNKEVVILTKKSSVKTEIPGKPNLVVNTKVKGLNSTENKVSKTSLDQTQNIHLQSTKTPRPNSFNTQFKSMIPIAKNTIRSPQMAK